MKLGKGTSFIDIIGPNNIAYVIAVFYASSQQALEEEIASPTIQQKYVTVRCNLNNEVRKAYKSK